MTDEEKAALREKLLARKREIHKYHYSRSAKYREKCLAQNRAYREANREKVLASHRAYDAARRQRLKDEGTKPCSNIPTVGT